MTSGELKVLMALDKLGEYIQNGSAPYKSIQGFFSQEDDGDVYPINYNEMYNDTGLTLTIDSQGVAGNAAFTISSIDTDIYDERKISITLSSPLHPVCIFSSDLVSNNNPYENRILSTNAISQLEDPRGFGSSTGNFVYFEMRFYPTV